MSESIQFDQTKSREGQLLNKWLYRRLIKNNQNILLAVTGPTGSGKSYACHRITELWYDYAFNKPYPVEQNTCFSVEEVMVLLNSGKLNRGDIIIFEEAGVNLGALDFQQKVSKLFTYVLQSFRSLNIGIIFNLPALSFLNKSARMLLHGHFSTQGIDKEKKECILKGLFFQLNQTSGKIYTKHLKVKVKGVRTKVTSYKYGLASKDILEVYEKRKQEFVSKINREFLEEMEAAKQKKLNAAKKKGGLTDREKELLHMYIDKMNYKDIAATWGTSENAIKVFTNVVRNKLDNMIKKGLIPDKMSLPKLNSNQSIDFSHDDVESL